MALRKMLAKRLFTASTINTPLPTPENSSILRRSVLLREGFTSTGSDGRRFAQRGGSDQLPSIFPEIFSVPVGEKLREKLLGMNINLEDPIAKSPPMAATAVGSMAKISVEDARKLLRVSQMEKLKEKLRGVSRSSISYYEFVQICREECGNEAQAIDLAKTMDQSGNVIVLGNAVFLRPEQMAKSMESIISHSMCLPNDPRRKELEDMENQKALIDQKAKSLVRGELYCGLGFLVVQTLGFMRLTFWELSWDVMEPICFFVTSLHFALAYGFFLRTSTEPSFEGYFQRRVKSKQLKLMTAHGFDIEKYQKLRQTFYPNTSDGLPSLSYN